nr:MAG TPA: hypothetical protein [Caudoviricetes sp.]
MRDKLLKELKDVELERTAMDMYGGSREEYLNLCKREKELREKLYNADYREITNEEVKDFVKGGY